MAGLFSTDFSPYARRQRLQRPGDVDCLSDHGDSTFVLHDVNSSLGNRIPPKEILSLRSVSSLAHFIAPIAGPDAAIHAKKLIQRFGSLSSVFETQTDCRELSEQEARILDFLHSARTLVEEAMHESMARSSFSANNKSFLQYIKTSLGFITRERVLAVFVDAGGHYLRNEIVSEGSSNAVRIPTRRIVRRALDLAAHGVLLAHNHPSGKARPSASDIKTTEKLREALLSCEIGLLDHFVVSGNDIYSMKQGALI